MQALMPVADDPRAAITQQELFTLLHERPDLLRQIPWESTPTKRGVIATNELERQALVNDFEFHRIPIQMRLVSLDALREVRRDASLTELRVWGPGRNAAAFPNQRVPDEEYVITEEWQDYPAFFANWLNHRAAEDPLFGAEWTRKIKHVSRSDDGEISVSFSDEHHPARRLLEWRMPADQASGERPSGLVVPPSVNFFADGLEEEETPPPPPPSRKR